MNRLDRYVFREVLAPTIVGFGAYTGFMLIRGLVQFSDLIFQSDNPARDTLKVLLLSLPHIVVLTIPVAFLLGLLIGIGRLSADSELIALRASGVDLVRLYRPIALLSGLTFLATLALMVLVVPQTNMILYEMKLRLSTFVIAQRIQPGVFSPQFAGRRIYVEGASPDRRVLTGLIVSDRSEGDQGERLTLAKRGTLELDEAAGQLWLRLEDAVTHHVGADPSSYDRTSYEIQRVLLEDSNPTGNAGGATVEKQLREQTLPELLARTGDPKKTVVDHRMTWVEVHKKFSLPSACLVFGLLGLPLGIVNRRGGRAAGFAISVAIVLGYYILLAGGEARAIDGRTTPFLAMWLPNLLLLALGIFAVLRLRRDLPAVPAVALPRFRRRDSGSTAALKTRRFSAKTLLLDRYVTGRFLRVFVLVVASILVLYVLIDYMEISDDIARNHPPSAIVLAYYEALLAPILQDVMPFAFLVAALVATAGLVRSSETTALLSSGISLFRSVASLLVLSAVTGILLFGFGERIVPRAASESQRLRDVILKHPPVVNGGVDAWFRGTDGRFFAVGTFDPKHGTAADVSVLKVDPATFRLVSRTFARRAVLEPGGLKLHDGWTRSFGASGDELFFRQPGEFQVTAPEASKVFAVGRTDPRQMSSRELSRFIEARRRSGADVSVLATGLYAKSANAFSALLLTLLGLPYAFRFGKRGAVAGIGVALLLGLSYLFISSLSLRIGETGSLPPLLAAWAPNVLFGLGAAHGLLGVRT